MKPKTNISYNLAGRKKSDEILSAFEGQGKEFTLFAIVKEFGECISGDVHVIDDTEQYTDEGEQSWRVYHAEGYCFEIKKLAEYDDETGNFKRWDFQFYSDWDNFEKCDVHKAIQLMQKVVK